MKTAEGDARHQVERRDLRMPHALAGDDLVPDDVSGSPEGAGVANEKAEVDVYGRVDGRPAEGEIAELYGTQLPQGIGQPEIASTGDGAWHLAA
jgi:hypothetical protein